LSLTDGEFVDLRPKGAYGVPMQYERSFRWKLGQFRYLCQVRVSPGHTLSSETATWKYFKLDKQFCYTNLLTQYSDCKIVTQIFYRTHE